MEKFTPGRDTGTSIAVKGVTRGPMMYCVSIMYPNLPGSVFNLQHYLDVHMPLSVGLLHQHFAIAPVRIDVLSGGLGADGTSASAPYHCVCNLHFKSREDVDRLLALMGTEEAARLLMADFPNFTQAGPIPQISLCQTLDPAELIAKAPGVLTATSTAPL